MKPQKIIILMAISTCLLSSSSSSSTLKIDNSTGDRRWGTTVTGLQMSISGPASKDSGVPEFQLALRDVGQQDLALNLGIMLGNGNLKFPNKITLNLTDAEGATRKLRLSKPAYVAGRVDDYIVLLQPSKRYSSQVRSREEGRTVTFSDDSIATLVSGSIYSFNLSLNDFWSPDTKEFQVKLSPGKYQITAQLETDGPTKLWSSHVPLMNFWKGNLQSNAFEFDR